MASRFEYNTMYAFRYDTPVTFKKIKVWDKTPFVFPLNIETKKGKHYMLGLNLHWLPPMRRAGFVKWLKSISKASKKSYDKKRSSLLQGKEAAIVYKMLKGTPYEKGIRMYRRDQIRGKIISVPMEDITMRMLLKKDFRTRTEGKGGAA